MRHGSLFSGIGGFDLASEWMGWKNVFHCEWNEFGQKVLKYYWPKAISYHDITKTDFSVHRGRIDILTGGFPCQPYSTAGKRKGKEDERHLWPEMLRAIREIQPTWVVGENVFGLVNWNDGLVFHEVQADLEAEGYEVQSYVLPAASVNAPHRRDRIWFVAYSKSCADSRDTGEVSGETKEENRGRFKPSTSSEQQIQLPTQSSSLFGDDTNSTSIGLCKHSEGQRLFTETLGASIRMGQEYATNSDSSTERSSRESRGIKEERNQRFVQQGERGYETELDNRLHEFSQNATDSDGIGLRGQGDWIRKSRFFDKEGKTGNWSNFPTVSPICTRDDGISDRLDSITFSKWRNESIKAGGNAIVPQVVHQIFKAIEQYETTRHTQGTQAQ